MKIGKVNIYKVKNHVGQVIFYLDKDSREILNSTKLVVVKKPFGLMLRRPSFDDNRVLNLHEHQFTYCTYNARDYIGFYFIEQLDENQDEFELIPIEELDND